MTQKIYEKMHSIRTLTVIFFMSLSLITFSSGDLIDDICRKSSDFKVCTDSLRTDPKSSSADEKGLVRILLQQCLAKATSIYNEIVFLLKETKEPVLKQCLEVCKDNYDGAKDDVAATIKSFDANDFTEAISHASAVESGPIDCEESFTEPPVRKSPTKQKSNDLINFVGLTAGLIDCISKSCLS
ncbi:cell wall / vacuolar inhibitor of fructosidase 2-like [Lycium ferocissimum]|uniref:cell wall / vacuolar inhibitor of fructosidase 2-like n=1 Tax=Lycium ferocissimum TaxID=112874 RepID=UPI0028156281|nr:cell wall / vacuolar inhibitor of fructosidase 2-like [Lycium ferocissimum]